jgi:hypothetical protein
MVTAYGGGLGLWPMDCDSDSDGADWRMDMDAPDRRTCGDMLVAANLDVGERERNLRHR